MIRLSFFRSADHDAFKLDSLCQEKPEDAYIADLLKKATEHDIPVASPMPDDSLTGVSALVVAGITQQTDPEWGARNAWANHDIG